MAKLSATTVDASVAAGLKKFGGQFTGAGLGIHSSVRGITGGTGAAISKAVSRQASINKYLGGRQIEWYGEKVLAAMEKEFKVRLRVASFALSEQTKRNLSKPVLKYQGPKSKRVRVLPESRSKPGEFPRADTTRLRKDIFHEVISPEKAVVGTTLDYGLILETRMDRSFLRRTLNENHSNIRRILVGKKMG